MLKDTSAWWMLTEQLKDGLFNHQADLLPRHVDMESDTDRYRESVLTLTTTLTCLDKSLELLWRKSEKAACKDTSMFTHTHTHKQRKGPNETELQFITFPSLKRDNSPACFLSPTHRLSLTCLIFCRISAGSKKFNLRFFKI